MMSSRPNDKSSDGPELVVKATGNVAVVFLGVIVGAGIVAVALAVGYVVSAAADMVTKALDRRAETQTFLAATSAAPCALSYAPEPNTRTVRCISEQTLTYSPLQNPLYSSQSTGGPSFAAMPTQYAPMV